MKRIAIVDHSQSENNVLNILQKNNFTIVDENPDYVLTLGGDGTFIAATKKFGFKPIYLPINCGTLGFYTSWTIEEVEKLILENHFSISEMTALQTICFDDKNNQTIHYAINESTLINPVATQKLKININDYHLENFSGTGVCISTPTGSTGYNKSLGGAILDKDLEIFQLVEMAPINNVKFRSLVNPIVLAKNETINLFPHETKYFTESVLANDSIEINLKNIKKITVTIANQKYRVAVKPNNVFWQRVKKSFLN